MPASFPAIVEAVGKAERILVVAHDRPDGDAVGSVLALTAMLVDEGKIVISMLADPVPETLRFLPGVDLIQGPSVDAVECDLVIALDSAGRDRISDTVWSCLPAEASLVVIDHHVSNSGFGDVDCIVPGAPATGEILFQLAEFAGWKVSAGAAVSLYAAISTDTGSFRYPSTTAETMRIGGRLIELGVDPGVVNRELYESYPQRRLDALTILLQDLRIECRGRCASVRLPLEETNRLGLRPGDTEGVIDTIRAVDTVIVAVYFEEMPDGKIRVSSRSKDSNFPVGPICAEFGGGGHALAAGARLPGPLEDASERFMSRIRQMFPAFHS